MNWSIKDWRRDRQDCTNPTPTFTSATTECHELEYQGLEEGQTRLHQPNSNIHFSYNRVPWKLRIRKEVFSPMEQISDPTTVHLIFCQIVADTFSPLCIRMSPNERKRLMSFMEKNEIDPRKVHSS